MGEKERGVGEGGEREGEKESGRGIRGVGEGEWSGRRGSEGVEREFNGLSLTMLNSLDDFGVKLCFEIIFL